MQVATLVLYCHNIGGIFSINILAPILVILFTVLLCQGVRESTAINAIMTLTKVGMFFIFSFFLCILHLLCSLDLWITKCFCCLLPTESQASDYIFFSIVLDLHFWNSTLAHDFVLRQNTKSSLNLLGI